MNQSTHCTRCPRELRDHETGRYLCRPCEDQAANHLGAIPGMYQQLGQHLQRSAGNGPAVSGSKNAPVPIRLDIVDLELETGPILGPLQCWVRDWEYHGRAELAETGPLHERVAGACRTLRYNLRWAVENHPAIDEAVEEFAHAHRILKGVTGGEKHPRGIVVTCPCEQRLRITLNTRGETCPRCRTEYGHSEVLRLPLAERRAAA